MSGRKNTKSTNKEFKSYLKMQGINALVYLIIFTLITLISTASDVSSSSMLYIAPTFIGIASFVSGFSAGLKERKKGIVCGIVNSAPLNAVFIIISLIMNGFSADMTLLVTAFLGLLASAVGGIVAVNIRLR